MKECFVIMPISDHDDYDIGHFERLYSYLIKPAVIKAGFQPVRADEIRQTNYIVLDIVQRLINAEMAICDLSSINPNVFYELGIRQSFNLPVSLIKDDKTGKVFDIQGFRFIEYSSTLRVDEVEKYIDEIATNIKNTYENKDGLNSLIEILGISTPVIDNKVELSQESTILLKAIEELNVKLNLLEESNKRNQHDDDAIQLKYDINKPEFDYKTFNKRDRVYHEKFGNGTIDEIEERKDGFVAKVLFDNAGKKNMYLKFARLMKISE